MLDPRTLKQVENLAAGLKMPGRTEEAIRHFEALNRAMNNSHTGGEQDALTVFEAVARLIGQLTANFGEGERGGFLDYITIRAEIHADTFREAGKGAQHAEEEPFSGVPS